LSDQPVEMRHQLGEGQSQRQPAAALARYLPMKKEKPRESKPVMRVMPSHDHFMRCAECGSLMDLRDFAQVMRHQVPGHAAEPSTH